MRTVEWLLLDKISRGRVLERPTISDAHGVRQSVEAILSRVQREGDHALLQLTRQYDHVELRSLAVDQSAIKKAYQEVNQNDLSAIQRAKEQIAVFHKEQIPHETRVETSRGIICTRRPVPIDRVGLYIPGGTAPLVSTVLMLAVPSYIAGCKERILATPPRKDGSINPFILVAADLCGVTSIFTLGGAQAIAALAYGTASVPKVDKIFGPGNAYVTEAKMLVSQDSRGAAIDMPAGPSEVMVIVDGASDADFAAADLLSQAEHDANSQVVLVSTCPDKIEEILDRLREQLSRLSRADIASQSLENSLAIHVENMEEALRIVNSYAPEHLVLLQTDPETFANNVRNCGSIFLGPYAPESLGDYASGSNHVLPTYGYAKSMSGLGTESFMKFISCLEVTAEGLRDIGPVVEHLAGIEGLTAHKNAVSLRLKALGALSSPCTPESPPRLEGGHA